MLLSGPMASPHTVTATEGKRATCVPPFQIDEENASTVQYDPPTRARPCGLSIEDESSCCTLHDMGVPDALHIAYEWLSSTSMVSVEPDPVTLRPVG